MPKSTNMPGILIELKAAKNLSEERLKKLSKEALVQIEDRKYDTNIKGRGVKSIFKYGVAFSGKHVEITASSH